MTASELIERSRCIGTTGPIEINGRVCQNMPVYRITGEETCYVIYNNKPQEVNVFKGIWYQAVNRS